VLWDIDLVVPEGKLVGILGPNGAGKSTLIKAVLGLIKAVLGLVPLASGRVTFYGQPYERQRHLVGYVPQDIVGEDLLGMLYRVEELAAPRRRPCGMLALARIRPSCPTCGLAQRDRRGCGKTARQ